MSLASFFQCPVHYNFHHNKNSFYYGQNKLLLPVQTLFVHLLRMSINKDQEVEASLGLYMGTSLLNLTTGELLYLSSPFLLA